MEHTNYPNIIEQKSLTNNNGKLFAWKRWTGFGAVFDACACVLCVCPMWFSFSNLHSMFWCTSAHKSDWENSQADFICISKWKWQWQWQLAIGIYYSVAYRQRQLCVVNTILSIPFSKQSEIVKMAFCKDLQILNSNVIFLSLLMNSISAMTTDYGHSSILYNITMLLCVILSDKISISFCSIHRIWDSGLSLFFLVLHKCTLWLHICCFFFVLSFRHPFVLHAWKSISNICELDANIWIYWVWTSELVHIPYFT